MEETLLNTLKSFGMTRETESLDNPSQFIQWSKSGTNNLGTFVQTTLATQTWSEIGIDYLTQVLSLGWNLRCFTETSLKHSR